MSDYIEWDGTERCLENLLIWWGQQIPWRHSDDCTDPNQLHCCEGVSEFDSKASLSGGNCATWGSIHSYCAYLEFSDGENPKQLVEVGDRIYYRGEGRFELVKNAKS